MVNKHQVNYHYKKWQEALEAVGEEADRLKATKGEAVIGPDNPYFVRLVMHEIECEQRYNKAAGIPETDYGLN